MNQVVSYFYSGLGLPHQYFDQTPPNIIAKHIISLQAAKLLAKTSGRPFDIRLQQEEADSVFIARRSVVIESGEGDGHFRSDSESSPCTAAERYIEARYLSGVADTATERPVGASGLQSHYSQLPSSISHGSSSIKPDPRLFRLQCYRSQGVLDESSRAHLRLYLAQAPDYANPEPSEDERSLEQLGCVSFLRSVSDERREVYQSIMDELVGQLGPVIRVVIGDDEGGDIDAMIYIGFHSASTHSYFTGVSDVYRFYNFFAESKLVESFSNGALIFMFTLRTLTPGTEDLAERLRKVERDCRLHYVLPRTSITPLLSSRTHSASAVAYTYCAWKFAFHFLNRGVTEYNHIARALKDAGAAALGTLAKLRKSIITQSYTEGFLLDTIFSNPELVRWCFDDFCSMHQPGDTGAVVSEADAHAMVKRLSHTDADVEVFSSFVRLNRAILKTNFFMTCPVALSFRLDPSFLPKSDFENTPFGVFFVVGSEFRGFHIRFRDVARGGIRIVRSRNTQDFVNNVATMFDECYNLANTQQRKNKDIPEGGSKGVILLNLAHQTKMQVAFRKYVDSLLDLMLPTERCRDHYGKEELLFLGPDENTADFMDWASLHARKRGYRYWKAFTTGKSLVYGGIPHDKYGMTTRSVRSYVSGIQRKLGLDAAACTKMQTGGPDGDLGSNEILLGKEPTIAVVDGSGVLFDPAGINREELVRLATARQMVKHVDKSLLSSDGFLVLCEDKDVTLPDGTYIENGTSFRNTFHLSPMASGDFFVPCGGRPAAVPVELVREFLFRPDGSLRWKYIVEGANLFFTPDARLEVEKAGVVMFKDASANKGGVTSSSLEVLAALSLTDAEFSTMMAVSDDAAPPEFYRTYVEEVCARIENNADLEFECLWRESERTRKPRTVLTDILSTKITELSARIEESATLWDNDRLRVAVLREAIPRTLSAAVGFDTLLTRLPTTYQRALFGSQLASKFIYNMGIDTPEFAFYEYIDRFLREAGTNGEA